MAQIAAERETTCLFDTVGRREEMLAILVAKKLSGESFNKLQ
jgi:hypothetical protein